MWYNNQYEMSLFRVSYQRKSKEALNNNEYEDVIIDISFIIIELIFGIITRLYLFKKVGIPRWKAFIPLYGDAVAYKGTDMSMLWVFSELPQILVSIPGLRVPVWLDGLAYAIN